MNPLTLGVMSVRSLNRCGPTLQDISDLAARSGVDVDEWTLLK